MSLDILKLGQGQSAEKFYENVKNNTIFKSEVFAVKVLTQVCESMINSYDEILQDQNDYITELEVELDDLSSFKAEQNEKLQKLFEEIKALEQKEQDGTITEEEKKELDEKKTEYGSLTNNINTSVSDKNDKIKEMQSQQNDKYRSKVNIAKNFGEITVEKGTPLAETEVKGGFFRKLFGTTGIDKKEAGENAVKVGNELLDNVAESNNVDADFKSKLKNKNN